MNDLEAVKSTIEKIKVMQAFCDGEEVLCIKTSTMPIVTPVADPDWDWWNCNFVLKKDYEPWKPVARRVHSFFDLLMQNGANS